jgi:c-di-AMP phosphodiesterase-like protein
MPSKKNKGHIPSFSGCGILSMCLGIAAFAVCALLIAYTDYDPKKAVLFSLAVYLGAAAVMFSVRLVVTSVLRRGVHKFMPAVAQAISARFVQTLSKPVVICNKNGRIVWYNHCLREACKKRRIIYNKWISDICDSTIERIVAADAKTGVDVLFGSPETVSSDDSVYSVVGYPIEQDGTLYYMAVFTDIT